MEADIIWLGSLASLLAGACSGIGALAVFVVRQISDRTEDLLLSVAAGIMLAASFFSLILPGIEYAEAQVANRSAAVAIVIAGIFIGAWALYIIHHLLPHEHFVSGREGPDTAMLRRIWLFIIAITLHNFPEGMAVGVGFAGGDVGNGIALATGIGLQNIPEGLAVAVSMRAIDYSRLQSFFFAFLTGLVEPVGGLFGAAAVSLAQPLMPWTLGFAA
ncbi:MAG TPA: ZIP family metal transporter, partial [Arenicellales bacterium]|nr:ZIP family metal transporter [Arenicellales bacterium]